MIDAYAAAATTNLGMIKAHRKGLQRITDGLNDQIQKTRMVAGNIKDSDRRERINVHLDQLKAYRHTIDNQIDGINDTIAELEIELTCED